MCYSDRWLHSQIVCGSKGKLTCEILTINNFNHKENAFQLQITKSDIFVIEKMCKILFDDRIKKVPKGAGLKAVLEFLRVAFSSSTPQLEDRFNSWYRIHVEKEVEPSGTTGKRTPKFIREFDETNKIVNLWCFSPAFG